MRTRTAAAAVLIALLSAACTSAAPADPAGPGVASLPNETLLLGTDAGPLAVRSPSGALVVSFPGALTSPDGSVVYSASSLHGSTVLESLEAATGSLVSSNEIRGELDVRVVSGSGRAAALMEPLPDGWDPWRPIPRARTTIVVADPTGSREPRRFELRGNYEPEAFSTDDRRLFLIQHLPALAPTVYRVTVLDLERGSVLPVFGPFKSAPERMPGTRLQQELSAAGDQLYTLYSSARPGYAPHDGPVANDAAVSFVHVLDLEKGWAHCVGLPEAMWDRPSTEQAMAATPDGRFLFVIDAGIGLAAVMDARTLQVRTARLDLGAFGAIERTTARMSADGNELFVAVAGGGTDLFRLNARTLELVDRVRLDGEVSGLGLSADGARLYAAVDGRMLVFDVATGRELGAVPVDSVDRVERVIAVED